MNVVVLYNEYIYSLNVLIVLDASKTLPSIVNLRNIQDINKWMTHPENIYIGRACRGWPHKSIWENIYNINYYKRKTSLMLYKDYVKNNKSLMDALPMLFSKTLGCWCTPQKCHGNILSELLEELF